MKQSPRAWYDRFRKSILKRGYIKSNVDHTLFFKHAIGKVAILKVYVDDIVITGDDITEIADLKKYLAQEFEVKDLGQLKYLIFSWNENLMWTKGDVSIPTKIYFRSTKGDWKARILSRNHIY